MSTAIEDRETSEPKEAETRRGAWLWRRLVARRRFGTVWLASAVLYVISLVAVPGFVSWEHAFIVLQIASFLGVVAIGQTIVMLTGGIDVSVGGVITASAVFAALIIDGSGDRVWIGVAVAVAFGLVIGLLNGVLVAVLEVPPLIATLAVGAGIGGIVLLVSHGAPRGSVPDEFSQIGRGMLGPVPIVLLIFVGVITVALIALRLTTWGRQVHAVGANPIASRLVGINVRLVTMSTYVVSATAATLTGLLLLAYARTPSSGIGDPYLLTTVAAAAVGGTLLTGAVGSALATAGGAIFLTTLTSLTNALHINPGIAIVLQGVIILVSVTLYRGSLSTFKK